MGWSRSARRLFLVLMLMLTRPSSGYGLARYIRLKQLLALIYDGDSGGFCYTPVTSAPASNPGWLKWTWSGFSP